MSKPADIYVIVPAPEGLNNWTMINNSTSRRPIEVRENDMADKFLYEMLVPQHSVFEIYQWYNKAEIKIELEDEEWDLNSEGLPPP